jgi:hypothetical protein
MIENMMTKNVAVSIRGFQSLSVRLTSDRVGNWSVQFRQLRANGVNQVATVTSAFPATGSRRARASPCRYRPRHRPSSPPTDTASASRPPLDVVVSGQFREAGGIVQRYHVVVERQQVQLAQLPQHAVDVDSAQSENIRDGILVERAFVLCGAGKPDELEPIAKFEKEVRCAARYLPGVPP